MPAQGRTYAHMLVRARTRTHTHAHTHTHTDAHTYKDTRTHMFMLAHTCSYTCPGQLVAFRLPGRDISERLYSIASTPYESRSESSGLAASLIEV